MFARAGKGYAFLPFSLLLTAAILFLAITAKDNFAPTARQVSLPIRESAPVVILDAGHGGIDSGAVSIRGAEEKHLNLAIAKKLGAFLEGAGVKVIYTRTEDQMLQSENGNTRKTRDLMARAELAAEFPEALFVSIHMNTLPVEKYDGLQVFYSQNRDENRALAQVIQNTVATKLQPENKREAKDAQGSIFLLDRLRQPAVLIECGFLSNKKEAALLEEEGYQNKLAFVLSRPILDFLTEREKINNIF